MTAQFASGGLLSKGWGSPLGAGIFPRLAEPGMGLTSAVMGCEKAG